MGSKEIFTINLKKNWRVYEAFLILIAILEGLMMVYGFWHFDMHELRRKIYFASYVFLLCYTVITVIVNRICLKREKCGSVWIYNAYLYNVLLFFWSAVISALDINGGGFAVTYMTILAAIGSLIPLHWILYVSMAFLSSACMVAIVAYAGHVTLGIPFFLNHTIFLLVVIAIQIRNYKATQRQYMQEKRMEELANIDDLTQVSNRRSLDRYMERLMQEGSNFSFVLVDVDNFKYINDTYGHLEGDESLMLIANILTEIFGEHVFRYGGDEFAVISFEDAKSVAEKMKLVNLKLKERNTDYVMQICSGVYYNEKQDDERKIFEFADSALYEAKQTGKARSVIYAASLRKA